jgi:hypothetical protein
MTRLKNFIGEIVTELVINKVNIHLEYSNKVLPKPNDPDPCEAFFEENPFTIKVATKYPFEIWAKDFLHEYSHFKQTIEKSPLVKKFNDVRDGQDANAIINAWINGKNTNIKLLRKCINAVRALELDCEQRVVDLIHSNALEISIDDYFKAANSYVLFYNMMLKERKWYVKSPVFVKSILDLMPDCFLYCYDDDYCMKHYTWYDEYCRLVKNKCF